MAPGWAKESYEIATKIAYRNDGRVGIPKGGSMVARRSQQFRCFLRATLLVRAGLLIEG
jgi:hypothetical protein